MRLRTHQKQMMKRANEVTDGFHGNDTVIAVTPGGGKTRGAIEFADVLWNHGMVDHVLFVVPNNTLQEQVEEAIANARKEWQLRVADNVAPLVRPPSAGYVTTYQSIASNPMLHQHAMRRGRWLVILDEFHHVADDERATWKTSIEPIVLAARHTLFMTGTPERHDGKKLPFVDRCYARCNDGLERLFPDIEYTLSDALAERAVIDATFARFDARVSWLNCGDVSRVEGDISTMDDRSKGRALATFMDKCSEALLERCYREWLSQRTVNPLAQMLVIAKDQHHAKQLVRCFKPMGETVALAISEDSESRSRLNKFRKQQGPSILVTVGMASEGFDAPSITHLCLLTSVRSTPWLAQAVARATRVDRSPGAPRAEDQRAIIYCPDDPWMRKFIEDWKASQQEGIAMREEREKVAKETGERSDGDSGFIPESGELTHLRFEGCDHVESAIVDQLRQEDPAIANLDPQIVVKILSRGRSIAPTQASSQHVQAPVLTPSQKEKARRKRCEELARQLDRRRGWEPGDANRLCYRTFGVSRGEMSLAELEQVEEFLKFELQNAGDAA